MYLTALVELLPKQPQVFCRSCSVATALLNYIKAREMLTNLILFADRPPLFEARAQFKLHTLKDTHVTVIHTILVSTPGQWHKILH